MNIVVFVSEKANSFPHHKLPPYQRVQYVFSETANLTSTSYVQWCWLFVVESATALWHYILTYWKFLMVLISYSFRFWLVKLAVHYSVQKILLAANWLICYRDEKATLHFKVFCNRSVSGGYSMGSLLYQFCSTECPFLVISGFNVIDASLRLTMLSSNTKTHPSQTSGMENAKSLLTDPLIAITLCR